MIQRIQTIYLLIAAIGSAGVFAFPFFSGVIANVPIFVDGLYDTHDHTALLGIAIVAILDAILTIFLYKNRKQQALFALVTAIANLLIIAFMLGILSSQIAINTAMSTAQLGIGSISPLLSIVAAIMARRSILADEALVRSMDRLR